MAARGTELVDAVIAALEGIAPANEFHTDSGSRVRRGRPEAMTIDADELPMITISTQISATDAVKSTAVRKAREITVEGLVFAAERDYEPELDEIDEDIARALAPLTAIDELPGTLRVELSGGDYQHPESGSNIASVSYTVTVSYALAIKAKA